MKLSWIAIPLLYLTTAIAAPAADHPPVRSDKVNCLSCHANKAAGKSVHSAMSVPCTTCHLAETRDSTTVFSLAMPREQICFACHQKSTTIQQHTPTVTGTCVDCHDSHSSDYPMLLTSQVDGDYQKSVAKAHTRGVSAKASSKAGPRERTVVAARTNGTH